MFQNDAIFFGAETRGYEEGSLLVENLIYFDTSSTLTHNDTELTMALEIYLQNELNNANMSEVPFDLYGLGIVDSLTVENIGK